MEFKHDPPKIEIIFTGENEWQRRKARDMLSNFLDEDEFITLSHNGDVLTANVPTSVLRLDVEYMIRRAANSPAQKPQRPQIERVDTGDYL